MTRTDSGLDGPKASASAFRDLKQAVSSDSNLQDFNQPLRLQMDASGVGIGAVLLQDFETCSSMLEDWTVWCFISL